MEFLHPLGVEPSTEFLNNTDVKLNNCGYVIVDKVNDFQEQMTILIWENRHIISNSYILID